MHGLTSVNVISTQDDSQYERSFEPIETGNGSLADEKSNLGKKQFF